MSLARPRARLRTRGLRVRRALAALAAAAGVACSGGGGQGGEGGDKGGSGVPGVEASVVCTGTCPQQALSVAQVQTIIAQAVAQVQAIGAAPATIAVVDRVGNVLAVFQMNGASATTVISSQGGVVTGLDGIPVQSTLAAISKAGTGAYLSTQGHGFTTRTASQIVQENFNPGAVNLPGGPLFGVQFSQLPCGDLVRAFPTDMTGPKRLPLGFSADPGGLPLYVQGVPVGGVGVELDGVYGLDKNVNDKDASPEELVASAAANGFQTPEDRRADRITVNGLLLRYADAENAVATQTPAFGSLPGNLVAVPGFSNAAVVPGALFLTPASGVVATTFQGVASEVLVNADGSQRFAPMDSTNPLPAGGGLTANEVAVLLREAITVANMSRAQIRRPLGTSVRVNVSVVDLSGAILGILRTTDAPIFGTDVSLQKARSTVFMSRADAGAILGAAPDVGTALGMPGFRGTIPFAQYVADTSAFTSGQVTLANGVAIAERTLGNLARPFFPDGINGNPNGPLSKPFNQWSIFSTGLQLELSFGQLAAILCAIDPATRAFLGIPNVAACPAITPGMCTPAPITQLNNGLQIFSGGVPIYRGNQLIGGIGVSGDGVEQDDLVSFLGLHRAGVAMGGAIGNAPPGIRGDTVNVNGTLLRYVNCPVTPFLDSTEQKPCDGL